MRDHIYFLKINFVNNNSNKNEGEIGTKSMILKHKNSTKLQYIHRLTVQDIKQTTIKIICLLYIWASDYIIKTNGFWPKICFGKEWVVRVKE